MWDLIVSVPDYCLSFYFNVIIELSTYCWSNQKKITKINHNRISK